jgi:hypothetical protein
MITGLLGATQRKATTLRRKAELYRTMGVALMANTVERYPWPAYVPRGKPANWYLTRAERYAQQADDAEQMASAVYDLEHQHTLETTSPEVALLRLQSHLDGMTSLLNVFCPDWPKLLAKLELAQRDEFRAQVEALVQMLREASR